MPLSIAEWRLELLRFFNPEKNYYQSVIKEKILLNFGEHIDDNFEPALNSLVADNIIIPIISNEKIFYTINVAKLDVLITELSSTPDGISEIIQPYDKNFKNLVYHFESERDKTNPHKGKYFHFTTKEDNSYWITIVKMKDKINTKKLPMGSLYDHESRLSRILKAIEKVTKLSKNKTFIKKNIEDADQEACGNERQYSSAAFDILEREKIIEEFSHKGRSKIYCLTGYRPHILTLDEIFIPLLKQQENENVPINKISF